MWAGSIEQSVSRWLFSKQGGPQTLILVDENVTSRKSITHWSQFNINFKLKSLCSNEFRNILSSSVVPVHTKKISSIYLFQMRILSIWICNDSKKTLCMCQNKFKQIEYKTIIGRCIPLRNEALHNPNPLLMGDGDVEGLYINSY